MVQAERRSRMKEIFDWLREQIKESEHSNPMVTKNYVLREEILFFADEAEAEWKADCCEWKKVHDKYQNTCGRTRYTHWCSCISLFKFCPYCGKPIKISEVE